MYAILGNYPACVDILLQNGSNATLGKLNRYHLLHKYNTIQRIVPYRVFLKFYNAKASNIDLVFVFWDLGKILECTLYIHTAYVIIETMLYKHKLVVLETSCILLFLTFLFVFFVNKIKAYSNIDISNSAELLCVVVS